MESPKVFISYSWTTPEHEQRVLDIATELVESGIDTILDKWDLKEGMMQMCSWNKWCRILQFRRY